MPDSVIATPATRRYAQREQAVRDLFVPGTRLTWQDRQVEVLICTKPHVAGGETKTDVFIIVRDCLTGREEHIKISFKLHSAEFIENKLTAARAAAIFGDTYSTILREAADALHIEQRAFRNTRKDTYVLGYRLDIMVQPRNRTTASKSYYRIDLDPTALLRIYAGTDSAKRDAYVHGYADGQLVPDAGIADYILFDQQFESAQQVLDALTPMVEYVREHPSVYLAFKAVNYRMSKHRDGLLAWDGNRPLAFVVDWASTSTGVRGNLNAAQILAHHANARGETFKALLG